MSLIINPPASADWSLKREQLADKGLMKTGRLGAGETASAADRALALDALDALLKNLNVHGYSWPKTSSTSTTVAFTAGLAFKALPQDFLNFVNLNYVDSNNNETPITMMTTAQWNSITNKTQTGLPIQGYIDNINVLWVWPVPSVATNFKLYYQGIILDTVAQSNVDLDAQWMLAIPYGIAAEIADEFELSDAKIARLEQKWAYNRDLCIMSQAPALPNQMEVDD